MLFYQIGELFQSYAVRKSQKNISELMDIRSDYANIEKDGKLEKVSPDEVRVGSIIIVQPGEKVPLDGIIIEGNSSLNTSALTGESLPKDAGEGDEIISGCININGVLKVKTTKEFGESKVSKILELVENSGARKSKSEKFISKFAKIYTPFVCYSALAVIPPLVKIIIGEYAALAECASSHPISRSLREAYGKEIDRNRVSDIEEISGQGVIAKVDGITVASGNGKLMKRLNIPYHECRSAGTIVHMAINGEYAGHIVISDIVKPNAESAIKELRKAGVKKNIMLTGDRKKAAEQVAAALGVDEVHSELLPADKVAKVEELSDTGSGKAKLAFVGDGINDAPGLKRADIGIAMEAMGSDAAIEAADIVLMYDNPMQIAKAIKISKKCLGIVYQNIVFALVIKFGCLFLGAIGIANMWFAIFADVVVMIIAVLNAIRALRVKYL